MGIKSKDNIATAGVSSPNTRVRSTALNNRVTAVFCWVNDYNYDL